MLLPRHARGPVGAVLVYVALGAAYTSAIPAWEAPDEPWHLAYAEVLAAGRAPTADDTYEAHQPPLYYALVAGVLEVLHIDQVQRAPANPYFPYADAAHWHPPGHAGAGVMRLLRTLSGFAAAAVVVLAWAVAMRLGRQWRVVAANAASAAGEGWRPSSPPSLVAAATAALFVALLPQFQHIAHAISNDGLAAVAGGLVTYVAVRYATGDQPRLAPVALAVSVLLGMVVKLTTVPVAAASLAGVMLSPPGRRAGTLRDALTVAAVVGGGLAAFTLAAPSMAQAVIADARLRAVTVDIGTFRLPILWALARDSMRSSWGRFGWLTVDLPEPAYWLGAAVVAVGLGGMLVAWRNFTPAGRRGILTVCAVLGAVLTVHGRHMLADPQAQGRLLFPALPGLAACLGIGWASLSFRVHGAVSRLSPLLPNWVGWAAVAVVAGVSAHAALVALPRAFEPWRRAPEPLALHILPTERVVAARLEGQGQVASQTFAVDQPLTKVAVAVYLALGNGTLELRLVRLAPAEGAAGELVARSSFDLGELAPNRWAAVRPPQPAPAGVYAVEAELVSGAGRVSLWGAFTDDYPNGALTVNGAASTDLSLVVTTPDS